MKKAGIPVAHERIHAVIAGAEAPQLHLLPVLDLLGITIAPFDGDIRVGVGVDENVESAVAVELGKEGDRGGDLSEYGLDLRLDFLFRLLGRCLLLIVDGGGVLLVCRLLRCCCFFGRFIEELDLWRVGSVHAVLV